MTKELMLLQEASKEVKGLRNQNNLMAAKLDMFDKCFMLLTANINNGGLMSMGSELVEWRIDNFIADKEQSQQTAQEKNS